jgi:hypothetical protein
LFLFQQLGHGGENLSRGYDADTSEMGHLFYMELGLSAGRTPEETSAHILLYLHIEDTKKFCGIHKLKLKKETGTRTEKGDNKWGKKVFSV